MIAFRDNLPVIALSNGQIVAFETDWLRRALSVAANRAGYPNWWLADHVSRSVKMWLESVAETTTVLPVATLTRGVLGALQVIGYAEIGTHFEAAAPFARVSLVDVARAAGDGFELAFFNALSRKMQEVMSLGASYCELHGLEQCVKLLRRTRSWNRKCERLQAEIVDFARLQTSICHEGRIAKKAKELYLYVA